MSSSQPPADSFLRLLLIDEDPVFRLGMRLGLNQYPDLSLVAEAEDGETALQILNHQFARPIDPDPVGLDLSNSPPSVNLVVLDIGLGRSNPDQIQGLNLVGTLKAQYPQLPLLCLSASLEPIVLTAVQQAGANGICPKTAEPTDLVRAMRRVARGQTVGWVTADRESLRPVAKPGIAPLAPAPLATLRQNLRRSGLAQIEAALVEVSAELRNLDLSLLDRAVLAGRQRELRAARWLVSQLLATPRIESPGPTRSRPSNVSGPMPTLNPTTGSTASTASTSGAEPPDSPSAIVLTEKVVDIQSIQALAFDTVLTKAQGNLTNQTEVTLEIDILREDQKRDLLYLVLRKLEELLSELRYSQVEAEQLPPKRSSILLDLWQAVVLDYFGRYYTIPFRGREVEVVGTLVQDAPIVQVAILDQIPSVMELFSHFLFQSPLVVDGVPYPVGNPESLARSELLLENLMIQVANAVIQPLLNHFAQVEVIKQNFYDRKLLSNREIERFRNNLSWRYRVDRVFREPKNMFESQHQLFTLTGRGIKQTLIYAPRTGELEQLSGLPYVVTLALETRDALAPRVRSAISLVGNSVVYVLTEVIGRGIGLIGRGVLKGLGNVWVDPAKYKRDRQR